MYPSLYVHPTFWPSERIHTEILNEKFGSLKDAVNFAKQTLICLRERNWYVYECGFLSKRRIPLSTLSDMGLISKEQSTDNLSSYYHWF